MSIRTKANVDHARYDTALTSWSNEWSRRITELLTFTLGSD